MNNESEFDFKTTFPPLEHPEHHFNKYPNHPWLKSKSSIQDFIIKYFFNYDDDEDELTNVDFQNGTIIVYDDFTVDFLNSATTSRDNERHFLTHIPFQIRNCDFLYLNKTNLKSAIGTPYNVWDLDLRNNQIESFEGISGSIIRHLYLDDNNINNFHKIPSFKSEQFSLNVSNNPILSWDGFTNIKCIVWWQDEWCESTSYDLLMQTPDSIIYIITSSDFYSPMIRKTGNNNINIKWLEEEQRIRAVLKKTEEKIEKTLISDASLKKRKL